MHKITWMLVTDVGFWPYDMVYGLCSWQIWVVGDQLLSLIYKLLSSYVVTNMIVVENFWGTIDILEIY